MAGPLEAAAKLASRIMPAKLSKDAQQLSAWEKLQALERIQAYKADVHGNAVVGVNAAIKRIPENVDGSAETANAAYKDCLKKTNDLYKNIVGVTGGLDPEAKAYVERASTDAEKTDFPDRQIALRHKAILTQEEVGTAVAMNDREYPAQAVAQAIDNKEAALQNALKGLDPDEIAQWDLVNQTAEQAKERGVKDENERQALLAAVNAAKAKQYASQFSLANDIRKIDKKIAETSLVQGLIHHQSQQPGYSAMSSIDIKTAFGFGTVRFKTNVDRDNPESAHVTVFQIPVFFRSLDAAGIYAGALITAIMKANEVDFEGAIEHINNHGLPIRGLQVEHNPGAMINFMADVDAVLRTAGVQQGKFRPDWNVKGARSAIQNIITQETSAKWEKHVENSMGRVQSKTKTKGQQTTKDAAMIKYVGAAYYDDFTVIGHKAHKGEETTGAEKGGEAALNVGKDEKAEEAAVQVGKPPAAGGTRPG